MKNITLNLIVLGFIGITLPALAQTPPVLPATPKPTSVQLHVFISDMTGVEVATQNDWNAGLSYEAEATPQVQGVLNTLQEKTGYWCHAEVAYAAVAFNKSVMVISELDNCKPVTRPLVPYSGP